MDEDILKIIRAAIWAPSGDNSQPWKFKLIKNKIYLINNPQSDTSLYNFKQAASIFSHGCLIENIKIASSNFGYIVDIKTFPDNNDKELVAIITFKKADIIPDPLYEFIRYRSTNRKKYNGIKIPNEYIYSFLNEAKKNNLVNLKIIEDKTIIKELALAASVNEKIVLENKKLHKFLFSHITWNRHEDEKKKGFFIDTLELNSAQKFIFRLASKWLLLKFLNKLSLSNVVSKDNANIYSSSSAIGIIQTENNTEIEFLNSGMVMQRIWLEASRLNISIQPITGIVLLSQGISEMGIQNFSSKHLSLIKNSYDTIKRQFEVGNKGISFMFRMGFSEPVTAKTRRLDPVILKK